MGDAVEITNEQYEDSDSDSSSRCWKVDKIETDKNKVSTTKIFNDKICLHIFIWHFLMIYQLTSQQILKFDGSDNNPTPPKLSFLFRNKCVCLSAGHDQSCDPLMHYIKLQQDVAESEPQKYLFIIGMLMIVLKCIRCSLYI